MTPVVLSAPSGDLSLLTAIPHDRPVLTLTTPEWEVQHLRRACATFDRFLFLKESVGVLDAAFWEQVDQQPGSAWLFAAPSCYLAIYDRTTLSPVLDRIRGRLDKEQSILWESRIHRHLPYPTIWTEVSDDTALRIDTIDGQPELVIGNRFIEKRKGTARCPGCSRLRGRGLCQHYLDQFATPDATVYLVRHGQADWNAEGRKFGTSDRPLTSLGIHQAVELAVELRTRHVDRIITSPLRRARLTADIIGHLLDLPVEIDDRLVERSFGAAEGMLRHEVDTEWPNGDVPGMETPAAAARRARPALARLTGTVAVVTHAGVIKGLTGSTTSSANGSITEWNA